jgi:hypothetical protein
METPYSRITELKEASTQEGANDLLSQGFILVKVMERYSADSEKHTSSIVCPRQTQVQRREPCRV